MAVSADYWFHNGATILLVRAAVLESRHSRRMRRAPDVSRHWYEFQDLRFTRDRPWSALATQRHLVGLPVTPLTLPERRVFSFGPPQV